MTASSIAPVRSIYLVHATETTREGLALLAGADGFLVVGSGVDLVASMPDIQRTRPQVLICGDFGANSDCVDQLRVGLPDMRIFLIVDELNQESLNSYICWDVHGLCSNDVSVTLLFHAIKGPTAGIWLDEDALRLVRFCLKKVAESPPEPSSTVAYTERELAILDMLVQGATNNKIAGQLGISVETVKTYIRRVMDKSGIRNRIALVAHYRTSRLKA